MSREGEVNRARIYKNKLKIKGEQIIDRKAVQQTLFSAENAQLINTKRKTIYKVNSCQDKETD